MKKLLIVAILATTMTVPAPANAVPVVFSPYVLPPLPWCAYHPIACYIHGHHPLF